MEFQDEKTFIINSYWLQHGGKLKYKLMARLENFNFNSKKIEHSKQTESKKSEKNKEKKIIKI